MHLQTEIEERRPVRSGTRLPMPDTVALAFHTKAIALKLERVIRALIVALKRGDYGNGSQGPAHRGCLVMSGNLSVASGTDSVPDVADFRADVQKRALICELWAGRLGSGHRLVEAGIGRQE